MVKSLANMGITVVATIHSPTPFTFSLFDQLFLLVRGSTIYFGPSGKSFISTNICLPGTKLKCLSKIHMYV